jgi:predicted GNAT family acetyltransferase
VKQHKTYRLEAAVLTGGLSSISDGISGDSCGSGTWNLVSSTNPKESRYELWLGDTRAGFIDYLSEPGTVLLVHTEVDPALEGQGLGVRLVAGALADLRARGLKLVPLCPFVRAYLRRHPEDADLVGRGRAVSK